jgi:DME family drug/metabolite transporter
MDDELASNPCQPVLIQDDLETPGRLPSLSQARWLVVAASLMWSTSGFFVKSPYFIGWTGPVLAFWRAVFACLILWPLVRQPRWTWRLVPMTVFFAGMNYTYLTAMVKGTAANAIWLQCTAPVWVLLVGVLVFGERAIVRDWLMIAFAMLGVGVILYYESHGVGLVAVSWGLASSFFFAGVVLSLRQLRGLDPVWLAAMNHLVTAIALAPLAIPTTQVPSGMQWVLLAGLGMFQMAVPYVLFTYGLKRIPGHEATGIGLIEPLLNPAWAYLAWDDRPAWWTLVGGVFIVFGLAIRYVGPPQVHRRVE